MTASIFWLVIGLILVIVEVAAMPGVGLFFAGLGGITLGGFMSLGIINDYGYTGQALMFLIFTGIWWVLLWKPLKKAVKNSKGPGYKNLNGSEGKVDEEGGLVKGAVGNIKWSGTRVRARIRPESDAQTIGNGVTIWVYGQQNGVFLVDDKEPEINS